MNIQLTIITVLVVVSVVSLVTNLGLWSDLRTANKEIQDLHKDNWHYYIEADSATDMYTETLAHLRGAEWEISWLERELSEAKAEIEGLEALVDAIHAASPITAEIWYEDTFTSEPPF